MATRLINVSAVNTTTVPALIANIRRLVQAMDVPRYRRLPSDVVWWARVVADDAGKGREFFNVVLEAAAPQRVESVAESMRSIGNWKEIHVRGKEWIKMRLYRLYARLAVLYLTVSNVRGRLYYERQALIKVLSDGRTDLVDFERYSTDADTAYLLTTMANVHYVLTANSPPASELRVENLKRIEQFQDRMEVWSTGDPLRLAAADLDTVGLTQHYEQLSPEQLQRTLLSARATHAEKVADVLAYMLAETPVMFTLFQRRRYKLAALFRDTLRRLTHAELYGMFANVSKLRALVDSWSNYAKVDREFLLNYAMYALAVIRETSQTQSDPFWHLAERRHAQFLQRFSNELELPSEANVPDAATGVRVEFLRNKACLFHKKDIDALPFVLGKVLGNGANGVVFATDDESKVVKVTDFFTRREYEIQKVAGEMGYAPRIYSHHRVRNALMVVNNVGVLADISFIVSERMHATMEDVLSKQTTIEGCRAIILGVLNLIHRFNTDGRFVHHDMKPDNVMLTREDAPLGDANSWRIIDYGSAWYGGTAYDPNVLVRREDCEPYGWNVRTSTVEDPREVYLSWLHTAPPAYIESWDRFCMLLFLHVNTAVDDVTIALVKPFRETVMEHLTTMASHLPDTYRILPSIVRVIVKKDMAVYVRHFDLPSINKSDPWRVDFPFKELVRRGDTVSRLLVPKSLLETLGATIVERIAADETYLCCVRDNCSATIRFEPDGARAQRNERLLRRAEEENFGPAVLDTDVRNMTRIVESDVRTTSTLGVWTVLLARSGTSLATLLETMTSNPTARNLLGSVQNVLRAAFNFVDTLAQHRLVHFSMSMDKLMCSDDGRFFLVDYGDVWSPGADITTFSFANGRRMGRPHYSLAAVLLFLNVYDIFTWKNVMRLDRMTEAALRTYMKRNIFCDFLQKYVNEVGPLEFTSRTGVSFQYTYTDDEGGVQRVTF